MPRPKLKDDDLRTREVAVLLTGSESRAVRDAARLRGVRMSAYVRDAALTAALNTIPTADEARRHVGPDPGAVGAASIRYEIRRLGSNLNQLLHLTHQGRYPDLQAAVDDLRTAVEKVLAR